MPTTTADLVTALRLAPGSSLLQIRAWLSELEQIDAALSPRRAELRGLIDAALGTNLLNDPTRFDMPLATADEARIRLAITALDEPPAWTAETHVDSKILYWCDGEHSHRRCIGSTGAYAHLNRASRMAVITITICACSCHEDAPAHRDAGYHTAAIISH